jgi:hypothetical protein
LHLRKSLQSEVEGLTAEDVGWLFKVANKDLPELEYTYEKLKFEVVSKQRTGKRTYTTLSYRNICELGMYKEIHVPKLKASYVPKLPHNVPKLTGHANVPKIEQSLNLSTGYFAGGRKAD